MKRNTYKSIRKPTLPASRIHEAARQRIEDSFTPDQIEEGLQEWHSDPAEDWNDGWDWDGPEERGDLEQIG